MYWQICMNRSTQNSSFSFVFTKRALSKRVWLKVTVIYYAPPISDLIRTDENQKPIHRPIPHEFFEPSDIRLLESYIFGN